MLVEAGRRAYSVHLGPTHPKLYGTSPGGAEEREASRYFSPVNFPSRKSEVPKKGEKEGKGRVSGEDE